MQARRDKQADNDTPADFLDCDTCPVPERPALRCGWLSESRHSSGGDPYPEASVCPGYLVRLPEVIEAARALSWQKRGGLVPLYGNRALPPAATDALDVLEGARNEAEAARFREMAREREQDRG